MERDPAFEKFLSTLSAGTPPSVDAAEKPMPGFDDPTVVMRMSQIEALQLEIAKTNFINGYREGYDKAWNDAWQRVAEIIKTREGGDNSEGEPAHG